MSLTFVRKCAVAGLVALTCLGGLWSVQLSFAGKPGGGGSGHTSLIYYSFWTTPSTTYQMYEDGTGKTQALPTGVNAVPSGRLYGGSRWWLTVDPDPVTGFDEIFAIRADGSAAVQLTAAGPDGLDFAQDPQWSNDLQDTFVTVNVGTSTGTFLCWLPVSGADVAAIQAGLLPPLQGADIESILPPHTGPDPNYWPHVAWVYSWSNQPGKLAYLVYNFDSAGNGTGTTVWVRDYGTSFSNPPTDTPIFTGKIPGNNNLFWSHDGSKIAFHALNTSSWGGVWTVRPDGTGAVRVVSNNTSTDYGPCGWSPDSSQLLVEQVKIGSPNQYQIGTIAAGGSG